MAGLQRLLRASHSASTGKLGLIFPPALTLRLMRWSGVQSKIAAQHYADAHAFASKGDYDRSIQACQASIAVQADNIAAYEVLVQIFAHLQRYEDALQACADALMVKPDSEAIMASLRQLLPSASVSSQRERVIGILQQCLTANPGRGDVLMLLVELLLPAHRYAEVVQACQRLLKVDPQFFPAEATIRNLIENPAAREALAGIDVVTPSALTHEYDWIFASNVIDTLLTVMSTFYARLGVDPQTVPLVQALERSRRKLTEKRPQTEQLFAQSLLISFERAWQRHQAGQTNEALSAFEAIINNPTARQGAAYNAVLKEAVVRSGEIAGRHYDALGDKEKAIALYSSVLSVEPSPIIARRLVALLSRSGRLAEAAGFAETAIVSRANLFARIPANPHISALKSELFLEPEDV
jgi:tetratricopeptide (TPR) repeat protein